MKQHLVVILRKMHEVINKDFEETDFANRYWYWRHSWTVDQEIEFKTWLVKYLKSNKEARKEICSFTSLTSKDYLENVAQQFTSNYGWKTEYGEKQK